MADAFNASINRSIREAQKLIAALEEIKDERGMAKAKGILVTLINAVNEAHTAMHPQTERPVLRSVSRMELYKKIRRSRG